MGLTVLKINIFMFGFHNTFKSFDLRYQNADGRDELEALKKPSAFSFATKHHVQEQDSQQAQDTYTNQSASGAVRRS